MDRRFASVARIAIAATARVTNAEAIALLDPALSFGWDGVFLTIEGNPRRRSRLAVEQTFCGMASAIGKNRNIRALAADQLDLDVLSQTAAETARAATIDRKLFLPNPQRRECLDNLHRSADDVGRKASRGKAVATGACAHPAVDKEDRRVWSSGRLGIR